MLLTTCSLQNVPMVLLHGIYKLDSSSIRP